MYLTHWAHQRFLLDKQIHPALGHVHRSWVDPANWAGSQVARSCLIFIFICFRDSIHIGTRPPRFVVFRHLSKAISRLPGPIRRHLAGQLGKLDWKLYYNAFVPSTKRLKTSKESTINENIIWGIKTKLISHSHQKLCNFCLRCEEKLNGNLMKNSKKPFCLLGIFAQAVLNTCIIGKRMLTSFLFHYVYHPWSCEKPQFIKASYFTQGSDLLTVVVYVKEIDKESLQVNFEVKALCLKFQTR